MLTIKHLSYTLVITTARAIARTGEVFCDDPIAPDVETETPLEDAVAWIPSQQTCYSVNSLFIEMSSPR